MKYYREYKPHKFEILGNRKKFDSTIYTFDIETSSIIKFNNKLISAINYKDLTKDEQESCEFYSEMYIWMLGVNDQVYFGRSWEDLVEFIDILNQHCEVKKYMFIHNLSFEFQFLKSYFKMDNVFARKSHKVISCELADYNFELRCSMIMSNSSLDKLAKNYNLNVQKLVGNLDYSKLRSELTELSIEELDYCEHDCLVVYEYIKLLLKSYKSLKDIPKTSTGQVRRELKDIVQKDYIYRSKVKNAVNINPRVYNLLNQAFMGGYTHANYYYADQIIKNVTSYDFTSSYPYVLISEKYPMSDFKICNIKSVDDMISNFAYLLVVKINKIKSKYYNNFISASKCLEIKKGSYDNGRIISADSITMCLTDLDFKFILESYKYKDYEIIESYFAIYDYLPIQIIDFILKKYELKTKYKNLDGFETEYQIEKAKFNAIYGMSVTNEICDDVEFDDKTKNWSENPISNEEIINKLLKQKANPFMSFSWGVWVTAYARINLLKNLVKLDDFVIYADTDSLKLCEGFDENIIKEYNEEVVNKLHKIAEKRGVDYERFEPKDVKNNKRLLGVFDLDAKYDEFITQGAKKYAFVKDNKIGITVAGVPKSGAKGLKSLEDFTDDYVFKFEDTNKNLLVYTENQDELYFNDYQNHKSQIHTKSGCCLIPTTYILGKALDYCELLSDQKSARAVYKE